MDTTEIRSMGRVLDAVRVVHLLEDQLQAAKTLVSKLNGCAFTESARATLAEQRQAAARLESELATARAGLRAVMDSAPSDTGAIAGLLAAVAPVVTFVAASLAEETPDDRKVAAYNDLVLRASDVRRARDAVAEASHLLSGSGQQ